MIVRMSNMSIVKNLTMNLMRLERRRLVESSRQLIAFLFQFGRRRKKKAVRKPTEIATKPPVSKAIAEDEENVSDFIVSRK